MYETQRKLNDGEELHGDMSLDSLIAALANHNPVMRQHARRTLVGIGEGCVSRLIRALQDRRDHVRWEAAKTLVKIASPAAGPALVGALRDKEAGVRWLAADALIALGSDCLLPVLDGLVEWSDSLWMREGAHHVLRELTAGPLVDVVTPILDALEGPVPEDRAPVAAYAAMDMLRQRGGRPA